MPLRAEERIALLNGVGGFCAVDSSSGLWREDVRGACGVPSEKFPKAIGFWKKDAPAEKQLLKVPFQALECRENERAVVSHRHVNFSQRECGAKDFDDDWV